jgi:hypothetical protein
MIHKQILVPDRVRRPPREGWSWVDRRFLREHAARLSRDAIALYLFLAAVSDQNGLSFYSDTSVAIRLRTTEQAVVAARDELTAADLVAFRAPLTQVLASRQSAGTDTSTPALQRKRTMAPRLLLSIVGVADASRGGNARLARDDAGAVLSRFAQ